MGYNEGVRTGYETTSRINPFSAILERVDEARARKAADDKDLKELDILFRELAKKHEYDQELKRQEGQQEIELEKVKGQQKIEEQERGLDFFNVLRNKNGGGGGDFPPGTTFSADVGGGKINYPLNREYTEAETGRLQKSEDLETSITNLENIITADKDKKYFKKAQATSKIPSFFGLTPEAGGDIEGQKFKLNVNKAAAYLQYLYSGAQINEKEYKRLKELLPSLKRDDTLDLENLKELKNGFTAIKGRIQSGAKWDEKKKEFIGNSKNNGQSQQNSGQTSSGIKFKKVE